jgi:hypothetical protein
MASAVSKLNLKPEGKSAVSKVQLKPAAPKLPTLSNDAKKEVAQWYLANVTGTKSDFIRDMKKRHPGWNEGAASRAYDEMSSGGFEKYVKGKTAGEVRKSAIASDVGRAKTINEGLKTTLGIVGEADRGQKEGRAGAAQSAVKSLTLGVVRPDWGGNKTSEVITDVGTLPLQMVGGGALAKGAGAVVSKVPVLSKAKTILPTVDKAIEAYGKRGAVQKAVSVTGQLGVGAAKGVAENAIWTAPGGIVHGDFVEQNTNPVNLALGAGLGAAGDTVVPRILRAVDLAGVRKQANVDANSGVSAAFREPLVANAGERKALAQQAIDAARRGDVGATQDALVRSMIGTEHFRSLDVESQSRLLDDIEAMANNELGDIANMQAVDPTPSNQLGFAPATDVETVKLPVDNVQPRTVEPVVNQQPAAIPEPVVTPEVTDKPSLWKQVEEARLEDAKARAEEADLQRAREEGEAELWRGLDGRLGDPEPIPFQVRAVGKGGKLGKPQKGYEIETILNAMPGDRDANIKMLTDRIQANGNNQKQYTNSRGGTRRFGDLSDGYITEEEAIALTKSTHGQLKVGSGKKAVEPLGGTPAKAATPEPPKTPDQPQLPPADEGKQPFYGAKNAVTEYERSLEGLPEVEKVEYRKYSEHYQRGQEIVESGQVNPRDLADNIVAKPRPITDNDTYALLYDGVRLKNELADLRKLKDEAITSGVGDPDAIQVRIDDAIRAFDQNTKALNLAGTEQSIAFQARKALVAEDYSLEAVLQRKRSSVWDAEKRKITPEEEAKVVELHKKLEDLQAKYDALYQEKRAKRMVESAYDPRSPRFGENNRVVTRARHEELKSRILKKTSSLNTGFDPTLISDLAEYIVFYLEGGARWSYATLHNTLKNELKVTDEQIKEAYTQAANDKRLKSVKKRLESEDALLDQQLQRKEPVPEIPPIKYDQETLRLKEQVKAKRKQLDVLTQQSSSKKTKTKTQAERIEARKRQLTKEIATLEERIRERKPIERKPAPTDAEVERLKAQASTLRKQLRDIDKQPATPESLNAKRLAMSKKRLQKRLDEINRAIERKEAIAKRDPIEYDAEALELKAQIKAQKVKLDAITAKPKPLGAKVRDVIANTLNAPVGILAAWDDSFIGRQGAAMLAHKPAAWAASAKGSIKALFSESATLEMDAVIRNDPKFQLAQKSGLEYADISPSSKLAAAEETAMYFRAAEKIPVLGKALRPFDRAYTMAANISRHEAFYRMADAMGDNWTAADYKAYAGFLNVLTGRGNLGRLSSFQPELSGIFISARKVAADAQFFLSPLSGTKAVRKEAAKTLVKYTAALTTFALVVNASGKAKVELNPDSTDFMKLRIGDTRWDLTAGKGKVIRSVFKAGQATYAYSRWGKAKYGERDAKDVVWDHLKQKRQPWLNAASGLWTGKDFKGDKITPAQVGQDMITPWNVGDVVDAWQTDGAGMGVAAGITGFWGVSADSYKDKPKKQKSKPTAGLPRVSLPK